MIMTNPSSIAWNPPELKKIMLLWNGEGKLRSFRLERRCVFSGILEGQGDLREFRAHSGISVPLRACESVACSIRHTVFSLSHPRFSMMDSTVTIFVLTAGSHCTNKVLNLPDIYGLTETESPVGARMPNPRSGRKAQLHFGSR